MRRRFRYDPDLEAVVEIRDNYFEERAQGPSVISDDVGAGVNGLRHMPSGMMLDSKSRHRIETKARGLEQVGNEASFASKREPHGFNYYGQKAKDAIEQIESNYNGVADRLRAERRK